MTRGNNLNGKHDEWEFTGLNIVCVGTILDGIFWIGIIRVGIFWVLIIPGRVEGGFGWEMSRWELFWVVFFQVGIVWVGVILSSNFPGGSFPCVSYPGW